MKVRTLSIVSCLACSILVAVVPTFAERESKAAKLRVRVVELRSAKGHVSCRLFDGPEGYPLQAAKAKQVLFCPIEGRVGTCRFAPTPRGVYALACFHDENDNRMLDTNWLGIPTEGTVASNHATALVGPPSFESARFKLERDALTLTLRIDY